LAGPSRNRWSPPRAEHTCPTGYPASCTFRLASLGRVTVWFGGRGHLIPAPGATRVRRDDAKGRVVAAIGHHLRRLHGIHPLFDVGRVRGRGLRVGSVSLADVLPAAVRPFDAFLVWRSVPARMVARLPALLAGGADPVGAGGIPADLLLLPRCLLQGVLGGSAGMRRRRTAQEVPRGALVPARRSERPPLLPLLRTDLHRHPQLRRVAGDVVSCRRSRR